MKFLLVCFILMLTAMQMRAKHARYNCPRGGCVCPAVYIPVCSTKGCTYGNICELQCVGGKLAYEGECK